MRDTEQPILLTTAYPPLTGSSPAKSDRVNKAELSGLLSIECHDTHIHKPLTFATRGLSLLLER